MRNFLKTAAGIGALALIVFAAAAPKPATTETVATVRSPIAAEIEFKVGDVIDIDKDEVNNIDSPEWPGSLECWSTNGREDLLKTIAILRDTTRWTSKLRDVCKNRVDATRAYEVMAVADGIPPYKHVYCVNTVEDFPLDKSGCLWTAFTASNHVRLSACKAGPALTPDEIEAIKKRPVGPAYFDVRPAAPRVKLPCQQQNNRDGNL